MVNPRTRNLCLVLLGVGLGLPGARSARAQPVVTLDEGTTRVPLGRFLSLLEDPSGKLTIDQVSAPAEQNRFVRSRWDVPNFGFTRSAYWVRFTVRSRSSRHTDWLLEVAYPPLDRLELYVARGDRGQGFSHQVGGDRRPFTEREIKHRHPVFQLRIPAHATRTVYLRVKTESSMQIPLTLWSPAAFMRKDHDEQAALWAFYGLMFVMALYNLFIFLTVRDRVYLFVVLQILSTTIFEMTLDGISFEYLWPHAVAFANVALPLTISLGVSASCQACRTFLFTRERLPSADKVLLGGVALGLLFALLSGFVPYRYSIRLSVGLTLLMIVPFFVATLTLLRRGFRPARFFLLAWLFFILGVLLQSLKAFGLVPNTFITDYGIHIGLAAEVVLLSFSLADRINLLKEEKNEAQARALVVEREAKENLQAEVDRQTEALREANQQLQDADREKTAFFQNVSHELRTPLTVIINPLERLLDADLRALPTHEVRTRLRAMERNAYRLLRLVNQLLDFARLESGRATVTFEQGDLLTLVEPVVEGFEAFARAKGLTLTFQAPQEVPRIYVDAEKLDTVLSNLLSNACKFTDEGGRVLVKITVDDAAVTLSVKDSGIGIAPEDQARIFERFGQADGSTSRRYQGTGIGLALARELVDLMGARLTLDSDVGLGSTFSVVLARGTAHIQDQALIRQHQEADERSGRPAVASRADEAAAALAGETGLDLDRVPSGEVPIARETPAPVADPGRPLVLVVEDNPDMRALVVDILREAYRVLEAADGREALKLLEEQRPALIVSDIMMPGMDGHELLKVLRAQESTAAIPVVLLTAKAGPESRLVGLESGADDYLTKPFDGRELRARVRNLVRLKQQERELGLLNEALQREVRQQAAAAEQAQELGRYLPRGVVESVMEQAQPIRVGYQRRPLTVFRAGLRGFGRLVEALEPEELAEILNDYLSAVLPATFEHGATVDQVLLDQITGFFGAPESEGAAEDASRCAHMAESLWEQMSEFCERSADRLGSLSLEPTIALHSGYATVGNFGSRQRMAYTAAGAVVFETEQLFQALSGGVVCTERTWSYIRDHLEGQPAADVHLPGRPKPVACYRLAGEPTLPITDLAPEQTRSVSLPGALAGSDSAPRTLTPDERAATHRVAWSWPVGGPTLSAGTVIAQRFEVRRLLGEGGMGQVYQARDRKLDQVVALKLLRPDLGHSDDRVERLKKEVRLSRLVTHRNVARIYDMGEWEGGEFVCMEFLPGKTLGQRIDQEGALPIDELRDIFGQLCAGLAAAHEVHVMHRDLKPSNVILTPDGRAVLLDFGLARAYSGISRRLTGSGELLGTPQYMAPEQITGAPVDHRADIYALGVLTFEMATGQPLFEDSDSPVSVLFRHVSEPPPDPRELRPELPDDLAEIILRCLAKKPEDRFSSTRDIAAA